MFADRVPALRPTFRHVPCPNKWGLVRILRVKCVIRRTVSRYFELFAPAQTSPLTQLSGANAVLRRTSEYGPIPYCRTLVPCQHSGTVVRWAPFAGGSGMRKNVAARF